METPVEALKDLRDRHYLSPEEFTKALHNDPDIFKEAELFYLEKLAQKEQTIIDELKIWTDTYAKQEAGTEDLQQFSGLLTELLGPLTPQARAEIITLMRQAFSNEWIHGLQPTLQAEILNSGKPASRKWSNFLPWGFMLTGLILLILSSYGGESYLLPIGGMTLLGGAVWLYLRS
jgi:hypothetical protein